MKSHHQRALASLLAGLFLTVPALQLSAQTRSKKKPVSSEQTTPQKKTVPKESDKKTSIKPRTEEGPQPIKSKPAGTYAAPNVSIASAEIKEFQGQPPGVQSLIESSLALARRNLVYTFGSADPDNGGMDCSGFIYYVLRQHGLTQVPRDSSGIYTWARKARGFRAVISRKPDGFEMDELLPGDLLFWTGTYATEKDPPVSHTMIYLGTEKSTGGKIMIGSSDGRTYRGLKRNGVSVFDFTMPRTPANGEQRSTFIGYARIPGLRD